MTESPRPPSAEPPKDRRWFVILATVTLIGFALFTLAITVLALRIPELKKSKYGVQEIKAGARLT